MRTTCARCWLPVSRASRSRTRSRSARRLTRLIGWPMLSVSSCRDPKPSRLARNFCLSAATGSSSSCHARETQGCYPPVSVFRQLSRLHACSFVNHVHEEWTPLFFLPCLTRNTSTCPTDAKRHVEHMLFHRSEIVHRLREH